jgi:hypothetical protein
MANRARVLQLTVVGAAVFVFVVVFAVSTVQRTRALRRVIDGATTIEDLGRESLRTNGECPASASEIGTLDARDTVDPWGSEFHIECAHHTVFVVSLGADRAFGTDDDIHSWNGRHMRPIVLGWPYRGPSAH